jgi:hypothetical protein
MRGYISTRCFGLAALKSLTRGPLGIQIMRAFARII